MKKKLLFLPLALHPNPEELQKLLQDRAAQGWNLDTMGAQSPLLLTLFPTEPRQFRFALDHRTDPDAAYRIRWEETGWERIASLGRYQLWRTDRADAQPLTNTEQLRGRCRMLQRSAIGCAVIFLLAVAILLAALVLVFSVGKGGKAPLLLAELVLVLAADLLCLRYARQLKAYLK